jgi:tetratricopeptide (TPR) repeat protein
MKKRMNPLQVASRVIAGFVGAYAIKEIGLASLAGNLLANWTWEAITVSSEIENTDSPVNQSIEEAAESSGHFAAAYEGLQNWIKSPGWHAIAKSLDANPSAYEDIRYQNIFEASTDFFNPLPSRRSITALTFLNRLNKKIYDSRGFAGLHQAIQKSAPPRQPAPQIQLVPSSTGSVELSNAFMDSQHEELRNTLRTLRNFIEEGLFDSAVRLLESIAPKINESTPLALKVEHALIQGNVALHLDDRTLAIQYWKAAFKLNDQAGGTNLNRGYAALLADEYDSALSFFDVARSRGLNDKQLLAEGGLRAQALLKLGKVEEAKQLQIEHPSNGEIILAMVQDHLDYERYDEVRTLLVDQIDQSLEAKDARLAVLDAHAAVEQLDQLALSSGLLALRDITTKAKSDPANTRLAKAIEILQSKQERRLLGHAYVLQTALFGRAGQHEASLHASRAARAQLPDTTEPVFNEVLTLIRLDRFDEALTLALTIPEAQRDPLLGLSIGEQLAIAKRDTEALHWLDYITVEHGTAEMLSYKALLYVEIYIRCKSLPIARTFLDSLTATRTDLSLDLAEALYARAKEDFVLCEAKMRVAVNCPIPLLADMARERFAHLLMDQERWSEALSVVDPLIGTNAPIIFLQMIVEAAVKAKQYAKAQEIIVILEGVGANTHRIQYLKGVFLRLQGDLKNATAVFNRLTKEHPTFPHYWLELAQLLMRLGLSANAVTAARKLATLSNVSLQDQLITVRLLHGLQQHGDAIKIAYQAYRAHPGDVDANAALVQTAFEYQPLTLSTVQAECVVEVESIGSFERGHLILTNDYNPDPLRDEIGVSSERGKLYLGKKIGDVVAQERNPTTLCQTRYKVVSIQDKYIFRARQVMEHFQKHFPGDQRFRQFSVAPDQPGGLDNIRAELFIRNEHVKTVLEEIRTKQHMLLELAGEQLSFSRFESWAILAQHQQLGHAVFDAGDEGLKRAHKANTSTKLLVDLSTLLVLDNWGYLEQALSGFELFVIPETIDALKIELKRRRSDGHLGITSEGQLQYTKEDRRHHQAVKEKVWRCIYFLERNAKVASAKTMLEFDPQLLDAAENKALLFRILSSSASSSELGAAIATEEAVMSDIAFGLRQVNGTNAILLCERAAREQRLSFQEFVDAWEKFLFTSARGLLPPLHVMRELIARDNYGFGQRVSNLCVAFAKPNYNFYFFVTYVALLVNLVWRENPLLERKVDTVRSILNMVWNPDRHPRKFVSLLKQYLQGWFGSLLIMQWQELEWVINDWYEAQDKQWGLVHASTSPLIASRGQISGLLKLP